MTLFSVSPSGSFSQELDRERVGRLLSRLTLPLLVVFSAAVVGSILPIRLLDPTWQLRFTASLINNSSIALFAMALAWLASVLHPASGRIRARRDLLASWAMAAVIGYLLLIPLQGFAVWRGIRAANNSQGEQLKTATTRLQELRKATREATNITDLQARLQALRGPALPPGSFSQPIESLRPQILAGLDTAETAVRQRFGGLPAERLWQLIQDSLRIMVSALAYAFAFSACSGREDRPFLLLDSLLIKLKLSRRNDELRKAYASLRKDRDRRE